MSRHRKLYVSELILRCTNAYSIIIKNTACYENISTCIKHLSKSEYWNKQVKTWKVNTSTHTLVIELI